MAAPSRNGSPTNGQSSGNTSGSRGANTASNARSSCAAGHNASPTSGGAQEECLELLAALQPRVAVYPGSFQPFHLGHWSILRRAEQTFDKVIVALGVNRQKLTSADSLRTRQETLQTQLPFHETAAFDGLLSHFLDDLETGATVPCAGVRDGTDLEAELRYARFLDELRPDTAVVWISCEPHYQHLSSSAIRELAAIQPGAERRYIPTATQIYGLSEGP